MFFALIGSRLRIPIPLCIAGLRIIQYIEKIRRLPETWTSSDIHRIRDVLKLTNHYEFRRSAAHKLEKVTLIIVAAEKEFELISNVILHAVNALATFDVASIKIITPKNLSDPAIATKKLDSSIIERIEFATDDDIVPAEIIKSIFRANFPDRENWCLQQFLKFFAVLQVETPYALVVDADTLLLSQRAWIGTGKEIALCPTFEYQSSYYSTLQKLEVVNSFPKFSFVPHHMFYSVSEIKMIAQELSIEEPVSFATKVASSSPRGTVSPFCIDYELYAQYEVAKNKGNVNYLRWANLPLKRKTYERFSRNPLFVIATKCLFHSISLHSWAE